MTTQFHRRIAVIAVLALLLVVGCGQGEEPGDSSRADQQPAPTKMTIYSIQPMPIEMEPEPLRSKPAFHGYRILSKTEIESADARKEIFNAVQDGIKNSDGKQLKCFDPGFGISTVVDGKTFEYVICFACLNMRIFENGEPSDFVTTTPAPLTVLDKHLKAAKTQ